MYLRHCKHLRGKLNGNGINFVIIFFYANTTTTEIFVINNKNVKKCIIGIVLDLSWHTIIYK